MYAKMTTRRNHAFNLNYLLSIVFRFNKGPILFVGLHFEEFPVRKSKKISYEHE